MADGSANPLSPSRPRIVIADQDQDTLTGGLLELDIVETDAGLYRCEALFGNWGGPEKSGFQYFGRDKLEFGKSLKIKLADDVLFEGSVGALRAVFPEGGPPQIGIAAEDRLQELRMTRRTRSFAGLSVADAVKRIADDHKLKADVDLTGPSYAQLAQINQSDLAFLRDLLRRADGQVWTEGDTLKVRSATQRGGAELALSWAGQLRAFEVVSDLAHQCTSLVAGGWDRSSKQAASFSATSSAIASDMDGGQSGMDVLQSAFGARVETLAHGLVTDTGLAQAQAESALRLRARRFTVGRGTAVTNAQLRVGTRVNISGLGPLFQGRYTVSRVHHRYDAKGGLRSDFECLRADIGRAGAAS